MLRLTAYRKKARRHFDVFEIKEHYQKDAYENIIDFSKQKDNLKFNLHIRLDNCGKDFPDNTFFVTYIYRNIPEIEEIFQKIFENEEETYLVKEAKKEAFTIKYGFHKSLQKEVPQLLTPDGYYFKIETEEDIAQLCKAVETIYYSQEVQSFMSLDLKGVNDLLLQCEDLNKYHHTLFCANAYLRTYIVAKLCNNQRVFNWFEEFIFPWYKERASLRTQEELPYYKKIDLLFSKIDTDE